MFIKQNLHNMNQDYKHPDFEDWEGDYLLIEEENWAGLVELRKRKTEKHPDDLYYQWHFAEALVFNQEFDKALEVLSPLYKKIPHEENVIHSILEALFKSGKTLNDFDWVETPKVLLLDEHTKITCIAFLKTKRKAMSFHKLTEHLIFHPYYWVFEGRDLFDLLKNDERFIFSNAEKHWDVTVKLCPVTKHQLSKSK